MGESDLGRRTKDFALAVVRVFTTLPKGAEAQVLGRQLLRCGTSVGAHYREARRARSDAEFVAKLEVALQELDEAMYWMELLHEGAVAPEEALAPLRSEADELIRILVTMVKKVKRARVGKGKDEG